MTFRDDLRKVTIAIGGRPVTLVGASFRGVPFLVETSELSTGRRTVTHEFPFRDKPLVEDLGQRARKFRLDGYVIGDSYIAQKNKLLDALETEGPGELVHPYYGVRRGIAGTVSVRETKADGGMAMFAIDFVETPAQAPTPAIEVDATSKVASAADTAHAAVKSQLVADYDTVGLPSFALASAEAAIKKASASLMARLAPIVADANELATLNGQLHTLVVQATSLARQPADLLDQVSDAITSLVTTAADAPGALYAALVAAYGDALETDVLETTATRIKEAANQVAIVGALRRTVAIEAARLAPTVPYASIDDATAARDQVAALLDEQAQTAGDTAYPALVDLRSQMMRAVPGGKTFAQVLTVSRRVAIPSLVLAYQLYGSVDLDGDVIARNNVKHPGFLSGDLKVLSNG